MIEIGFLVFGIILLVLGKISLDKFEKKHPEKENNSGVYFQVNTHLLVIGFILVLVSLIMIFNKN